MITVKDYNNVKKTANPAGLMDRIKIIFKKYSPLLMENNLDDFYDELYDNYKLYIPYITYFLIENNVDILKYLTKIPAKCFYNSGLSRIELPDTITKIERESFLGTDLKEIIIPGTVEYIDAFAFQDCTYLKTVEIKEGVKIIFPNAFENIAKQAVIYLPKSIESMYSPLIDNWAHIVCYKNSYAEEFCKKHDLHYEIY